MCIHLAKRHVYGKELSLNLPLPMQKHGLGFTRLSSAMVKHHLACENPVVNSIARFTADGRWWPPYSERVSAVALRKYADASGEVPPFLQSVAVPSATE